MKRRFYPFIAAMLLSACTNTLPKASYDIIPAPKELSVDDAKRFAINPETKVYYGEGLQNEAQFLSDYVNDILHFAMDIEPLQGQSDGIALSVAPDGFDRAEAYEIKITPKQIRVKGSDAAGVFYAVQTLRKSLPLETGSDAVELPGCVIRDWPTFAYRGMHLDPCRHFIDLDSVKIYIDMMAMHNMNQFHFHLTEDQGWRMEIKQYPELTKIGAWRDGTVVGRNGHLYDSIRHGGFYTQEELRDLIQYAAARHINIIPEIDLPGHMQAALATYPQMGCTGGPYEVWQRWGVSDDVLCAGNEETMRFVETVLNEVMDVFPSEYIHIGGDECPKVRWEKCAKCQAKIKELGLRADGKYKAEDYLQSYVMNRMAKVVEARGRRVIGWDELLEGAPSQSTIIMSWRGTEGGTLAARKGHDVIMTPQNYLYFNFFQSDDIANEPTGHGGYLPMEFVYNYQPLPKELTPEQQQHIIGVQANVWTEYITSFNHVEYMALPRMAALAELQWNNPDKRDYEAFVERCRHLARLYDLYRYNYGKHIFEPQIWTDTVTPNLVTRKPITLREEPNERYAYKGAPQLVDGELGRGLYNSGRWLGFWGKPLDAVVDLGQPAEMSRLRFRALINKPTWIYNPSEAKVLVSDDGVAFREVAQQSFPVSSWRDKDGVFTYELEFSPVVARFVEVVVKGHDLPNDHDGFGHPAWIFVDEIEVW